ncbi:hypothetical protein ABIF26_004668 [Bradyrhizobium elkanii]
MSAVQPPGAPGAVEETVSRESAERLRAGGGRGRNELVDLERLVLEGAQDRDRARIVGAARRLRRRRGQVDVVLQQAGIDGLVVLPNLQGVRLIGIGYAVDLVAADVAPMAVEVIEAVVLLIDDDDVLVLMHAFMAAIPQIAQLVPDLVLELINDLFDQILCVCYRRDGNGASNNRERRNGSPKPHSALLI